MVVLEHWNREDYDGLGMWLGREIWNENRILKSVGTEDREWNKTDMAASLIEYTREQQFEVQILCW
jgi:hypothetical protein